MRLWVNSSLLLILKSSDTCTDIDEGSGQNEDPPR